MSLKWYGEEIKTKMQRANEAGLMAAAEVVQEDAILRCPIGDGHLKQSIKYKVKGEEATVGSNLEYAVYVEFGTGVKAEGGRGRKTPWWYYDEKQKKWIFTTGGTPRPYLRPALDENIDQVKRAFNKEYRRVLK